jgi:hypothetical protein
MTKKLYLVLALSLTLLTQIKAQLTGTKNIPGDYPDLAAAITALNSGGVGAGGVTINLLAGNPQTAPLSGYVITASGTAANQIVFNGNDNNITGVGGAGAIDAIIVLHGSDYVTIDNFNLTVTDATIEYGIALLTPTANEGCQYNTIKNCDIDLDKSNANSMGITTRHHTATSATALTVSNTAGTNSYNNFLSNDITDCYAGYVLSGFASTAPYTFFDQQNTIDKQGSKRSRITNFGGGPTTCNVIYTIYQNKLKIANTNINGGTGSTASMVGIYVDAALNASVEIAYDTISLQSNTTTLNLTGILNNSGGSGAGNTVNIHHNRVENCTWATGTSGVFTGISSTATATYTTIAYNIVNSNNITNGTGIYTGIGYSGSSSSLVLQLTINDNVVSNNSKTGTSGTFHMINYSGSANTTNVYNNQCFGNTQSGNGDFNGLFSNAVPVNINVYDNSVYSNTHSGTGNFYGIFQSDGDAPTKKYVYRNAVYANTGAALVNGITYDYALNSHVFGNRIYNLSSTATGSTGPYCTGITQNSASSGGNMASRVYNNFISDLKASAAASVTIPSIIGIYMNLSPSNAVANEYIHHNTVYLNASSTGANFSTAAVFINTTGGISYEFKNNIFTNISTSTGTGKTIALGTSANSIYSKIKNSSGYNCYYAGTPSASNVLLFDGTNSDQTLQDLRNRLTPKDQSSFTELPPFINVATAPYDLHLQTGMATQCEGGGQAIAAVTTDYDNNTRGAVPDVGADEITGTTADNAGPNIQFVPLGNDEVGSSRAVNLFATITDPSGINTTASTKPRMYYKKTTQANTFNDNTSGTDGWKWVEASNSTSPFSFTIDYTKLNGGTVANGDSIQYFIIAQDLNGMPRLSNNLGSLSSQPATVDIAAANFPFVGQPNKYKITSDVFSGNINVNSSDPTNFNLTQTGGVFDRINNGVVTGNLTLTIQSNLAAENGAVALKALNQKSTTGPGGQGTYSISIVPDGTTERVISGLSTAAALIRLDSADNITLDGRFGGAGRYIRIRNNNGLNPGIALLNDAQNNTIRNCIVESSNTTVNTTQIAGAINIGSSNIINGTGGGNSNNKIIYNEIRDRSDVAGLGVQGVVSVGSTSPLEVYNRNNTISNNDIHDQWNVASTNIAGVYLGAASTNYNIDSNSFYQTATRSSTAAMTMRPIWVVQASANDNLGGHNVRGNKIGGGAPNFGTASQYTTINNASSPGTWINVYVGITFSSGTIPSTISNNIIKQVDLESFRPSSNSLIFTGISYGSGVAAIDNNQIGAPTGNDSVKVNITTSTNAGSPFVVGIGPTYGLNGYSSTINDNKIGGITLNGNHTGNTFFQGISLSGNPAQALVINNNLIGSTSTANSFRNNITTGTVFVQPFRSLLTTGAAYTVSNNTFQNISNLGANASSSTQVIYFVSTVGASNPINVSNNTIADISDNTAQLNRGIAGIEIANYNNNIVNIEGNTLRNITTTNTAAASIPIGIYFYGNMSQVNINKNKIYGLNSNNTTANDIYGIYANAGNTTITNNMISIVNGTSSADKAIYGIANVGYPGTTLKAYYNSIFIGGSNGAGTAKSFGYARIGTSFNELRNNLIYVNRIATAGAFAVGDLNITSSVNRLASDFSYNTYVTRDAARMGIWNNATDQTFAQWKTSTGGDKESYYDLNTNVLPENLFTDTLVGDLSIKTANAESWYVNGKGIAGAASENTLSDFGGDPRGITVGTPTDIGADEFTTATTPPDCIVSPAPALSTTSVISFANRPLAELTWGASGTVPTMGSIKYYSGLVAPGLPSSINSYLNIPATGGSGYTYDAKVYYTIAENNGLSDGVITQYKKDGAAPWAQLMSTYNSDAGGKYLLSTGLNSFSEFGMAPAGVLSLTSLNLNGSLDARNIATLLWSVQEQNIATYTLEKASNGLSFLPLYTIQSKGNGNNDYYYTELNALTSLNYYRVKQISKTGVTKYSAIIKLTPSFGTGLVLQVYPNPAVNLLQVTGATKGNVLQITNATGQLMHSSIINQNAFSIDMRLYPSGVYYIKTENQKSIKVVKQ